MSSKRNLSAFLAMVAVLCLLSAGCSSIVKPTLVPYTFVSRDPELRRYVPQVYNPLAVKANPHRVVAEVTAPAGHKISYHGSLSREIGRKSTLEFGPGVYPFVLRSRRSKRIDLCGAMMVVNVDETVALATFGRTQETKLFSPQFLSKAAQGVLTSYTITFDEQPVILYWLGNRTSQYAGGPPDVELDFSGIRGLTELRINGKRIDGFVTTVSVYGAPANTGMAAPKAKHTLEMTLTNGRKYKGYIKNLRDSAFTAFVRVPCVVPPTLFQAADGGTISRFTVVSEGDRKEDVAEIVFGFATR